VTPGRQSAAEHTNNQSAITCPNRGTLKTETMPTDACRFFYECTGCGVMLRPTSSAVGENL
jgi:hypothetical protein